jgi:hypothetical protein
VPAPDVTRRIVGALLGRNGSRADGAQAGERYDEHRRDRSLSHHVPPLSG